MLSEKPILIEVHELLNGISSDLRKLSDLMHCAAQCKSEDELSNDVRLFTPEEWEQIAITLAHWHMLMMQCQPLKGEPLTKWISERCELFGYMRDIIKVWVFRLPEGGKA